MPLTLESFDVSTFKQHRTTVIFGEGLFQMLPRIVAKLLPNRSFDGIFISHGPAFGNMTTKPALDRATALYFRRRWIEEHKENLLIDTISLYNNQNSDVVRNLILNGRHIRVSAFFLQSNATRLRLDLAGHVAYYIFQPTYNQDYRRGAFAKLPGLRFTYAELDEIFDIACTRNCCILCDITSDNWDNILSLLPLNHIEQNE